MPFCHVTLRGQKPLPKGYPVEPKTLGDLIRKRRMDLGLLQREAAAEMGVGVATLRTWERNRRVPALGTLPAVVRFIGHVPSGVAPFPTANSPGDRLRTYRLVNGLSRTAFARQLGVDPATLGRWEAGWSTASARRALSGLNASRAGSDLYPPCASV